MLPIMIHALFSNQQFCCCGERFPGTWIAGKVGMGATGDLEANPLATTEAVGGWPDVDLDAHAAICLRNYTIWGQAYDAVAQINRLA